MRVPYRALALTIAFSTACSILGAGALAQQGPRRGPPLEKPTNLQVLPKDISTQDLLKTMHGFTVDLGVRCTFCHAEDPQTHRINFALDTKPEKNTARVMIRMTRAINTQYLATLPGGEAKAVLGPKATPTTIAQFNLRNGLDLPIWDQLWRYIEGIFAHFDLGYSYKYNQGVTQVIRGADLLEATHIQVLLQRLLGFPTPIYRHHRLLLRPDGKRYAKRDTAETLREIRASGVSAAEFRQELGFS